MKDNSTNSLHQHHITTPGLPLVPEVRMQTDLPSLTRINSPSYLRAYRGATKAVLGRGRRAPSTVQLIVPQNISGASIGLRMKMVRQDYYSPGFTVNLRPGNTSGSVESSRVTEPWFGGSAGRKLWGAVRCKPPRLMG